MKLGWKLISIATLALSLFNLGDNRLQANMIMQNLDHITENAKAVNAILEQYLNSLKETNETN